MKARGPAPSKVAVNHELAAQLKLQDEAARRMVGSRFQHGALDLETIETHPVMEGKEVVNLARLEKNRATSLIEEFMVAANGVLARTFDDAKVASIRRIVRTPKRWDRIVELADRPGPQAAGGAGLEGAERVSAGAEAEGSGSFSGSVAGSGEADGAGRVCAGAA